MRSIAQVLRCGSNLNIHPDNEYIQCSRDLSPLPQSFILTVTLTPLKVKSEMIDEFKKMLDGLTFDNGKIIQGNARVYLASVPWIAGLQKRMEETLGPNGTYAVIYDASAAGGKLLGEKLAKQFAGLPVEEQVRMYFKFGTLRGIGNLTVTDISLDPVRIVVRYDNSYITGLYSGESEGKCYLLSGFATILQAILKANGIDRELVQEETKCVAMGHDHCEIIIHE